MSHLTLALLGPMQVALDGQAIAFPYEKVRALFAYLAIESRHPHHRDSLATLFWAEQGESKARSNLRKALSTLRCLLGETAHSPLFLTTRNTIQFNPTKEHTLDVAQLTALLDRHDQQSNCQLSDCKPSDRQLSDSTCELQPQCVSDLEHAVALYRGAFLDQMQLSASEMFETWLTLNRQHLHQRVVGACVKLFTHYEHQEHYQKAQYYVQRQLQLDPWNESAHRGLMRILAQHGQRTEALKQYDRCHQLLQQEFDAEPEPDTIALYEAIRTGRFPGSTHLKPGIEQINQNLEIANLVQLVREKIHAHIQIRCSSLRVLDMSQPIELNDIYTTVHILKSIRGRQRRAIADLLHDSNLEDFKTLGSIQEERISGLTAVEQHSKLIVLGMPGAGKTTFLKWIAIQCNSGQLSGDQVPVFITLKAFAEANGQPSLLKYLQKQWTECGIWNPQTAEMLLQQGQVLVLLDGLDEVKQKDHDRVFQEIHDFSTQFHACRFVITCRIAAREYTFEQFTEVEIADFDDQQICNFVRKWFAAKADSTKAEQCIQKLQENYRIKELATNSLLLTLLCLIFEESAAFSPNRSELYREGLNILLKKWDAKRNLERDILYQGSEIYQQLSLQRKEALLSQIAFATFDRGDYFFKQQMVEQHIADFISVLPDINPDLDTLEPDCEAVLKSIEVQHGLLVERAQSIYSFSHLTFQEYFTAKKIADSPKTQLKQALQALVDHITEPNWREVFLLTVSMLPSADDLLRMMKAEIDGILSLDEKIQQFLVWLNAKANSVETCYKRVIVRAYYSYLLTDRPLARVLSRAMGNDCSSNLARVTAFDTSSDIASTRIRVISSDLSEVIANISNAMAAIAVAIDIAVVVSNHISNDNLIASGNAISRSIISVMDRAIALTSDPQLKQSLPNLKNQLPDPEGDVFTFQQWWKDYGYQWTQQLKHAVIKYRNLEYDWQFSEAQLTLLDQYYRANCLLVECLNSNCTITPAARNEIEETLLLSLQDIKQPRRLS